MVLSLPPISRQLPRCGCIRANLVVLAWHALRRISDYADTLLRYSRLHLLQSTSLRLPRRVKFPFYVWMMTSLCKTMYAGARIIYFHLHWLHWYKANKATFARCARCSIPPFVCCRVLLSPSEIWLIADRYLQSRNQCFLEVKIAVPGIYPALQSFRFSGCEHWLYQLTRWYRFQ